MVNPSIEFKTSAIEVGDIADADDKDGELNNDNYIEDSSESLENNLSKVTETSSGEGIMSLDAQDSITFSIGGAGQSEVVETGVDEVAYRRHTVNVSINDAEDYYLMISGQPTLMMSSGAALLEGIAGGNVTGANIPAGQWGYGWDYTGTKSDDEMIYTAVPLANTKIEIPALADNAVNFAGKLNFAAKFSDNATLGSYTSNVTLTLVVTPKANTGSGFWRDAAGNTTAYEAGTTTMQGISDVDGGFCKGNNKIGEGWTVDLQDKRGADPVTYTIVKLNGNCWMAENLSLAGPLTLTTDDTDLASGSESWLLPASVGSGGTNTNNVNTSDSWDMGNTNVIQVRAGKDLANWKSGYGDYYSWCAVTAGSCLENDNPISNRDAVSSICPKGWRLPSNSGTGSYQELKTAYSGGWYLDQTINGVSGMYGYRFGYNNPNTSSPYYWTNFWPAAGYISNSSGSLGSEGSNGNGRYWSRSAAFGSASLAYHLDFDRHSFDSGAYNSHSYGFSVRCVADY